MLATLIGNVDLPAAAVLCVLFVCCCIISTTILARRRSRVELNMQFEVDKTKLRNEDQEKKRQCDREREVELAKIATDRDVRIQRITNGLIEGKVIND